MQTIIDLDLRQAISDFAFKSPAPPYAGKSQDTQSHEIYFVQGGNVQDLGTGPAIKFGLIGPGGPSLLVLQTSYTRQVDANGTVFYLGYPIFNTSNLASALGTNPSIACIAEVRYQLTTGEIEHTLDIPMTIYRTILSEITSDATTAAFIAPAVGANVTIAITGTTWLAINQQLTIATAGIYQVISITDATHFVAQNTGQPGNATSGTNIPSGSSVAGAPVNALTTYPPSNTLELISTRDVASGHAGLTAAKLLNPTVIPVDGDTIAIVAGQLASAAIITDTTANFTTPAANATVSVAVVSTAALVIGQYVRIPIAGYYKVTTITDATDVVLTNIGDPWNAAAGVTITAGAALLPAQATSGGGSGTPGQNAYTLTSASFTVPPVGGTVSVAMVATGWLGGSGYYVFITNAGYYAVNSITDGTHAVLTNAGGPSNAPPGTVVPASVQVAASGLPGPTGASGAGLAAYDALASAFTMPAVSGTVTITIGNTAWISVNQIIYIATAGYLQVSAISSATQALVTNLNYPGNATAGATIASGSRVSPGGLQGPQGAGGAGLNAFTTLSANFTQPAINATVTINVASTAWMAAGQGIFIQGGGYYTIVSISDATHAVVTNLGGSANPAAGSTVIGNGTQNVAPAGIPGVAGSSSYTTTTASFVMPAVAGSITVTFASTTWMAQGQNLYVVGAGYFDISSITDATHAVLINLGSLGNVSSGTTIPSGSMVSTAGATGPTGQTGNQGGQGAPGSLSNASDAQSGAVSPEVSLIQAIASGTLSLKKLKAGANVTLTDQGGSTGDILIAASGGGGGPAYWDPSNGLYFSDDFAYNSQPNDGRYSVGIGTGALTNWGTAYGQNATLKVLGAVELSTGTSASSTGASFSWGGNNTGPFYPIVYNLGAALTFKTRVFLESALPATGGGYALRVGIAQMLGTQYFNPPIQGFYFEYSPDNNSGQWRIALGGASPAYVNTSIAAAFDTAYDLEIDINAAWTSVNFLINGTVVATVTSGIPTTSGWPIWQYAKASAGAVSQKAAIDSWMIYYPVAR
jgi:hypothetical protein